MIELHLKVSEPKKKTTKTNSFGRQFGPHTHTRGRKHTKQFLTQNQQQRSQINGISNDTLFGNMLLITNRFAHFLLIRLCL